MIGNVLGLLRCLSKASHLIYIIIDLFPVISVSIAKVFERIVYDQFYSVLINEDKGCFFGGKSKSGFPNPKTDFEFFLGKFKNGSWIHKIHTQGGFFGSNPNPDFLKSFLGKGLEKSIFDKRFSERKWYTTDAVHVWHSNWTYVAGALTLSH